MLGAVSLILCLMQAPSPAASSAPQATPKPAPDGPVVVLETTMGTIKIGLYQQKAPLSTANFLQYVKAKHYDGTIFHRVMPRFMIQGGGMTADLTEKPTRPPIRNEARNGLRNARGSVAMARTDAADSATSQFFINVVDNHALDFGIRGAGYAVFGEVIEGMDVVDKIRAVPTTSKMQYENVPVTAVVIKTARLEGAAIAPAKVTPRPATPVSPDAVTTSPRPVPRPGGARPAPRHPASPAPKPSPASP
jgi:peptidyl-prolyl cis-trans isomerase A (cyclophilin A)